MWGSCLSIIQCYSGSDLIALVKTCAYCMKLVQIGSSMSKLDQTCPNWIKLDKTYLIGHNLLRLNQICRNRFKLVKMGPNIDLYGIFLVFQLKVLCPAARTKEFSVLLAKKLRVFNLI